MAFSFHKNEITAQLWQHFITASGCCREAVVSCFCGVPASCPKLCQFAVVAAEIDDIVKRPLLQITSSIHFLGYSFAIPTFFIRYSSNFKTNSKTDLHWIYIGHPIIRYLPKMVLELTAPHCHPILTNQNKKHMSEI